MQNSKFKIVGNGSYFEVVENHSDEVVGVFTVKSVAEKYVKSYSDSESGFQGVTPKFFNEKYKVVRH